MLLWIQFITLGTIWIHHSLPPKALTRAALKEPAPFLQRCSSCSLAQLNHTYLNKPPTPQEHHTSRKMPFGNGLVKVSLPEVEGTVARIFFWSKGWSMYGAYVYKQVLNACTSPSGIIKATTTSYQHGLTKRQSIWHLQQLRLWKATRGLSTRYSVLLMLACTSVHFVHMAYTRTWSWMEEN